MSSTCTKRIAECELNECECVGRSHGVHVLLPLAPCVFVAVAGCAVDFFFSLVWLERRKWARHCRKCVQNM